MVFYTTLFSKKDAKVQFIKFVKICLDNQMGRVYHLGASCQSQKYNGLLQYLALLVLCYQTKTKQRPALERPGR